MGKLAKISSVVGVVVFGSWFYATPYIAISGAEKAAKQGDAAALAGYVDFPALKASLKTNITASIAAQSHADPTNPMQALGIALANAFVDPLVEVMVTPQNLALMFQGKSPSIDKSSQHTSAQSQGASSDSSVTTKAGYESYDRFVIHIKNDNASQKSLTLVLNREGLATWKLAGIRIPVENATETVSQPQKTIDTSQPVVIPPVSNSQQLTTTAPHIAQPVVAVGPAQTQQLNTQPKQNNQGGQLTNAFAPSFDCAKVSTGAERLICNNQQLSSADVKLAQVYQAKRERVADKEQLKSEQIAWRRTVRDACSDVNCMINAYQQRIAELSR